MDAVVKSLNARSVSKLDPRPKSPAPSQEEAEAAVALALATVGADGADGTGVANTGAPVALSGDAELAPSFAKARLALRATVEVRIPLVGAKVENFIGNQLVELLIAEQRFTTGWIAERS